MNQNRELRRLIRQQKREQGRNYVVRPYPANIKEKYAPHGDIEFISDIQTSKHQHHERISWGQPAQITSAKMDRRCPVCGVSGYSYEGYRLQAGFSCIEIKGEIVGALCAGGTVQTGEYIRGTGIVCDWSFADEALIAELEKKR